MNIGRHIELFDSTAIETNKLFFFFMLFSTRGCPGAASSRWALGSLLQHVHEGLQNSSHDADVHCVSRHFVSLTGRHLCEGVRIQVPIMKTLDAQGFCRGDVPISAQNKELITSRCETEAAVSQT